MQALQYVAMDLLPAVRVESPLKRRLRALNESLEPHLKSILILKQKTIQRLLDWKENLEGCIFDGELRNVSEGIRPTLEVIPVEDVQQAIQFNGSGAMSLVDGGNLMRLGYLHVPANDPWLEYAWTHIDYKIPRSEGIETMTFMPWRNGKRLNRQKATHESHGLFLLTDEEERVARIMLTIGCVRDCLCTAYEVQQCEFVDVMDEKTRLHIQKAMDACTWLEENL